MGCLIKRGKIWHARIGIGGRDCWFSTEHTDKDRARAWLVDKERELRGEYDIDAVVKNLLVRLAELPKNKHIEKRREIARMILGGSSGKLALPDVWDAFIKCPTKRNEEGPATLSLYASFWKRFQLWAAARTPPIGFLHEVAATNAEAYAGDLWGSGITASTFNRHIGFLRRLFTLLENSAGLVSNPWRSIPLKSKHPESRRAFTAEELSTICTQAKGTLRYLVGLGLMAGLRLGDAVTLRWSNIDFSRCVIILLPHKTARTGKSSTIPLPRVLSRLLQELRKLSTVHKDGYLFPEEAAQYQRDRSAISQRVSQFFKSCGIETTEKTKGPHRKMAISRLGFHALRHSYASLLARSGAPQVAVQELLGHSAIAVTQLYEHAGEDTKTRAVAKLPNFFTPDSSKGTQAKKTRAQNVKS